jgi:hypothetical protein
VRLILDWLFGAIVFFFLFWLMFDQGALRALYSLLLDWQTLLAGALVGFSVWATLRVDNRIKSREDQIVQNQISAFAIEISQLAIQLETVYGLLNEEGDKKTKFEALLRLKSLPKSRFFTPENLEIFKMPGSFIGKVINFYYDVDDIVDRFAANTSGALDQPDADRLMNRIALSLEIAAEVVIIAREEVEIDLETLWLPLDELTGSEPILDEEEVEVNRTAT